MGVPADSASVRSVFIISPDKGADHDVPNVRPYFAEVLRALDGLQATFGQPIATPANWTTGQDVIVALTLNDDQAPENLVKLTSNFHICGQQNTHDVIRWGAGLRLIPSRTGRKHRRRCSSFL